MVETTLLRRVLARPGDALRAAIAIAKGRFYKAYYPLRGRRFRAGRNLKVFGRLSIRGPGQVIFGDDVTVWLLTTPWTHSPDAVITIGDGVRLSGTRFGCVQRITVGRESLVAESRIMDSDFHPITPNRRDPNAYVRTAPVSIGKNVWVAPQTALLPGTTIGDNCVVSFGSVCGGTFPANTVIVGNPARLAGKIPGIDTPAPLVATRDGAEGGKETPAGTGARGSASAAQRAP